MSERASCAAPAARLPSSACRLRSSSACRRAAAAPGRRSSGCLRGPSSRRDGRWCRAPAAADCVTALFPAARPCDDLRAALGRRSGPVFDPRASATTWIVAEGLATCNAAVLDRIVEGWCDHSPDCAAPLVTDGGCDVRFGRNRVGGALRAGAPRVASPHARRPRRLRERACSGMTLPTLSRSSFARPRSGRWTKRRSRSASSLGGPRSSPSGSPPSSGTPARASGPTTSAGCARPSTGSSGSSRSSRSLRRATSWLRGAPSSRPTTIAARRSPHGSSHGSRRVPSSPGKPGVWNGSQSLLLLWRTVRASPVCACAPSYAFVS